MSQILTNFKFRIIYEYILYLLLIFNCLKSQLWFKVVFYLIDLPCEISEEVCFLDAEAEMNFQRISTAIYIVFSKVFNK